jgi:hypothetical protein
MINEQSQLPDLVYERLFQRDADGAAVLEELAMKFYDSNLFVPGQPDQTNFNLGARSVIVYIMERAATKE